MLFYSTFVLSGNEFFAFNFDFDRIASNRVGRAHGKSEMNSYLYLWYPYFVAGGHYFKNNVILKLMYLT